MNIKQMIKEWRKGCSCADNPIECEECTMALINAIEGKLSLERRGCFEAGFEKAGGDWYTAKVESAIWNGENYD